MIELGAGESIWVVIEGFDRTSGQYALTALRAPPVARGARCDVIGHRDACADGDFCYLLDTGVLTEAECAASTAPILDEVTAWRHDGGLGLRLEGRDSSRDAFRFRLSLLQDGRPIVLTPR